MVKVYFKNMAGIRAALLQAALRLYGKVAGQNAFGVITVI
jgi:hypothetical protein